MRSDEKRAQSTNGFSASPLTPDTSRIYLASRSPRRRELLHQLGVGIAELPGHETPDAEVDETPRAGEPPVDYVTRLARAKALAGWRRVVAHDLPPLPVLAADTTVVLAGAILGKPDDAEHAHHLLSALSGNAHEVLTAVAVVRERHADAGLSCSAVEFRDLTDAEIRDYVASGEPFDKAGAYAIQGRAAGFVRALAGSYSGVMGLPLIVTARLLLRFGIASNFSGLA